IYLQATGRERPRYARGLAQARAQAKDDLSTTGGRHRPENTSMSKDAQDSLQHLDAMLTLGRDLATESIAVFEHRFDYLHFGSWVLVAGSRHRRVRLVWD